MREAPSAEGYLAHAAALDTHAGLEHHLRTDAAPTTRAVAARLYKTFTSLLSVDRDTQA